MNIMDFLKRRKNVVHQESEGIDLAIYTINQFENRTFAFKGLKRKYHGLSTDNLFKQLREELDSMLVLYHYMTQVKTFTDKKGTPHAQIKLIGKAGSMNRYNILDIKMYIKTEMTET